MERLDAWGQTKPMANLKWLALQAPRQLPQRKLREHNGTVYFITSLWRNCSMPDPRSLENTIKVLAKVKQFQ